MTKTTYAILSGEGERGTWRMASATDRGIKRILTRERCHGDRWAHAYELFDGVWYDVETGEGKYNEGEI
jgi:hypothetical protein